MRRALLVPAIVMVSLLVLSVAPGISWRARATIGSADSIAGFYPSSGGLFYGYTFSVFYKFTYTGSDCIEARLYFNNVLNATYSVGCSSSGTFSFGLSAASYASSAGAYQFQLWSTSSNTLEYSRIWTTPGFAMSVSPSSSSANAGETVGIAVKWTLAASGPDYLSDSGSLNVTGASGMTEHAVIEIADAHYLGYLGIPASPLYEEATTLVPVSFGTAGSESVSVQYTDPFASASGSASISIVDPLAAQIAAVQSELTSMQANESANATRLAQLSGEIAALQGSTSTNDTQDRAALASLASLVSQIWSNLNATQSSTASVQSAVSTAEYISIGALVFGAAGLLLGAMAYRKGGKREPE